MSYELLTKEPTGAEILAARHGWIRAMRTLRNGLELRDDLPESLQRILRRLDEVVARTARRRGGRGGGGDIDIEPGDIDGDIAPGPGDDMDGGDMDNDIESTVAVAAEQVMMAGEAIESMDSATRTGAPGGSGA